MKRFRSFFKLPVTEKALLIESLFLVAFIGLALRIVPFRFFRKIIAARLTAEDRKKSVDWKKINPIVRSVRSASRFVPLATCLPQALAAMFLIKTAGQSSNLKIGVAKDDKQHFKAHAWLEINGRIIIGKLPLHSEYKVLDSYFG